MFISVAASLLFSPHDRAQGYPVEEVPRPSEPLLPFHSLGVHGGGVALRPYHAPGAPSLYSLTRRRHIRRQGLYPPQPGAHSGEVLDIVAALVAHAGVYVEGNIGHRGASLDEELAVVEMPLHHPQGPVALLQESLQIDPSLRRHLDIPHAPEAR